MGHLSRLRHARSRLVSNYWVRYGTTKLDTEFGANGNDWRKFPGTTIDFSDIQSIVNQEKKRWWQDETFVGGVVQGGNGLFTMRIKGSAANGLGSYRTRKNTFGLWLDSHGIGTTSTTADSDSDGIADIHEYAFNMNPVVSDRHTLTPGTGTFGLPFFEVDTGATPILNVIYLRRRDALDLTYSVEFTGNLAPDLWTTAMVPETITPIDSIWEQIEVGDHDAPANASSRFGRVRIGYIPIP